MRPTMMRHLLAVLLIWAGLATPLPAQDCGGVYTVRPGDTLFGIARTLYGDGALWQALHASNRAVIGAHPDRLRAGTELVIDCVTPPAQAPGAAPGPSQVIDVMIAGDRAPFADKTLPEGGMLTQIVDAALAAAAAPRGHALHWAEDQPDTADPLAGDDLADMRVPWPRPDCAAMPEDALCARFRFSDPMFELLTLLFTDVSRPLPFAKDADLEGRTLCRPRGLPLHDLDRPDRRWIAEGAVTLLQPATLAECFGLLIGGQVDAVAVDEFSGGAALRRLGLQGRVEANRARALSIDTLHVLVPASHPEAGALLTTINTGLRMIHRDGTYQRILDAHLGAFWAAS